MAAGIQQLRRELREAGMPDQLELQEWLDPFYRGRIGIRLLINHHICEAKHGLCRVDRWSGR